MMSLVSGFKLDQLNEIELLRGANWLDELYGLASWVVRHASLQSCYNHFFLPYLSCADACVKHIA